MKRSGAHLECCLTSSVRTGAVSAPGADVNNKTQHPVRIFASDGISFSLSTDDPVIFSSTLNQEYMYAQDIGLDFDQICRSVVNGINAAFLPDSQRRILHDKIVKRIEEIRIQCNL